MTVQRYTHEAIRARIIAANTALLGRPRRPGRIRTLRVDQIPGTLLLPYRRLWVEVWEQYREPNPTPKITLRLHVEPPTGPNVVVEVILAEEGFRVKAPGLDVCAETLRVLPLVDDFTERRGRYVTRL